MKGEDGQTYTQWQGDGDIPTGSGWSDLRILASPHHHFARQLPCATRCQPCLPPPLSPRSRPSSRFPLRLIAAPRIKVSVENAGIVRGHAFVKGIVTATSNDGVSGAPAETAAVPPSLCAARRRRCPSFPRVHSPLAQVTRPIDSRLKRSLEVSQSMCTPYLETRHPRSVCHRPTK